MDEEQDDGEELTYSQSRPLGHTVAVTNDESKAIRSVINELPMEQVYIDQDLDDPLLNK
jgi:hypothetical protein